MIVVGVDAHKRVHAAVAVDATGQEIGQWRGPNHASGWEDLARWAAKLPGPCIWGIEGAWGYGRGLAQRLVAAGERVHEVNPRWTALGRRHARKPGKSDSLDAKAVALFVRQEEANLAAVQMEDQTTVLDLLTTEREGALSEATRLRNQIHALLGQVEPGYRSRFKTLRSQATLNLLEKYASPGKGVVDGVRAAGVRRLAQRLQLVSRQVKDLTRKIETLAAEDFAPLTQLCGVNLLTAGALAGILGGRHFSSDAELAAYAGVAPLEASSAGLTRHRLNRGGNRRLNSVLYFIALTQAHHLPEARAYLDRRTSEGKTRREARRALTRYIVRALWHLWEDCRPTAVDRTKAAAA